MITHRNVTTHLVLVSTILIGLTPLGCGHRPSYDHARIAGEVTIANQPVMDGSVTFVPTNDGPIVGARVVNGRYDCRNVPLGRHRVTFNAMRETGKFDKVGEVTFPIKESILPPAAVAGVELEVTKDNESQDFKF